LSKLRTRRVADQIRQTLAEIVMRELRDPNIGFVTITSVELSSDLRYAKAFVSLMGSPEGGAVREAGAGGTDSSAACSRTPLP
jgi:ribosome-binding factor A